MPLSDSLILTSSSPTPQPPPGSLVDLIYSKFDSFPPDRIALLDDTSGQSLSFGELKRLTGRVASGLAKIGFGKGHVLSLFGVNCIENVPIAHGTLAAGGTLHLVKPKSTKEELQFHFGFVRPRVIVTTTGTAETVLEALRAASVEVKGIYVIGGAVEGCRNAEELLEDAGDANPWGSVEIDPRKDVALIMQTGGTTGMSKNVVTSHEAAKLSILEGYQDLSDVRDRDLSLGYLPFNHIFSFMLLHGIWLHQGIGVVNISVLHPETMLRAIEKHKITRIGLTPVAMAVLQSHPYFEKADMSSIFEVVMGATTIPAETEMAIRGVLEKRVMPDVNIQQAYAMTEMVGAISWYPLPSHPKFKRVPGSTGLVSPSIELQVVSCDEQQRVCKAGERGEIRVRSPRVMKGYLNNEEATNKAVVDGWLHTGDFGYFNEDEYLFLVDRVADLIKHKDGIVLPTRVEGILRTHSGIKDCAVIGRHSPEAGTEVVAYVVRCEGCQLTAEEVQRFGAEHLEPHERLTGGVHFVESIPKSPAGKLLRSALRE